MSIFENVRSQYIDDNGKCRALIYDDITLTTSPLPPLDVPQVGLEDIIVAPIDRVNEFIKRHDLKIVEQDGSEEDKLIQGVWVLSTVTPAPIVFGYIQVEIPENGTNSLPDIPFSRPETTDPLFTGTYSELDEMRKNSRIANYLKQYSLFEWANDPENFGIDTFYVKPDHEYDIQSLNNLFVKDNDVLYYRGWLIVPDEDTAKRLVNYVKVAVFNDPSIQSRYADRKAMDGSSLYTSITDFRREKKQLVFMGRDAVLQWKMERARELVNTNVYSTPRPHVKEPYYYRNLSIKNGRLMIIQNTQDGTLPMALAVSKNWEIRRVNEGYTPDRNIYIPEKNLSFEVYTEEGKTHNSETKGTDENPRLRVFSYEDGSYGAVLFL